MVSPQQRFLNNYSRFFEKPALAAIASQPILRNVLKGLAPFSYKRTSDMRFSEEILSADGVSVPGMWCDMGAVTSGDVILYLHGGAFTIGGFASYKHLAAQFSRAANAKAVIADYRLAPEHPFPAGVEDALTAYKALLAMGYEGRQISIVGDSAGGGLTYALLSQICTMNLPKPLTTVTIAPWVDLSLESETLKSNQKSEFLLPISWLQRTQKAYLNGQSASHPLASPVGADFPDAPASLIVVGAGEILVGDAKKMAERLAAFDVDVTLDIVPDVAHVWHLKVGKSPEADSGVTRIGAYIQDKAAKRDGSPGNPSV